MKTLLIFLALAGSSNAFALQDIGVEVLLGAQVYGKNIKIQARSGGCTWKESFLVKKSLNLRQNSTDITFVRVIPDYCEAYLPDGKVFTFSLAEMKLRPGQRITITNPISTF